MENDIYDALNVISTLLWGALIVVAFLMACFLAWRAILWLRDRRNFDDGAVADIEDLKDPLDQEISRPLADHHWSTLSCGELGGLEGMNRREQEELLLFCGTRKQPKAIRKRRRAALAGMNQLQREEFLLIHGSVEERRTIKDRRKTVSKRRRRRATHRLFPCWAS
jgi:hypothetical protein